MKQTRIGQFGWGVVPEAWEGGVTPDADGNWPEGVEAPTVVQRTLYITVFTQPMPIPPTGAVLQLPVEQIALPMGLDQAGRPVFEKLAKALMGEELPPEVDVAKALPDGLSPAAQAILSGARPPRR